MCHYAGEKICALKMHQKRLAVGVQTTGGDYSAPQTSCSKDLRGNGKEKRRRGKRTGEKGTEEGRRG